MPLCPQITNTPITVTQTADFTVSSILPLIGDTKDGLASNISTTATQATNAFNTANTALANAATAYSAAIGSLQPSASTIVNASNQMTAIAANGITVYSGSSPSTGARVVMNSLGLAGYDASNNATFSISATTGAAVFSGSVTGSTITGGSLNIAGNAIINSSGFLTATGATITGTINASGGYIGSATNGWIFNASGYLVNSGLTTFLYPSTAPGGNANTYALYSDRGVLCSVVQVQSSSTTALYAPFGGLNVGLGITAAGSAFVVSSAGAITSVGNITSTGSLSTGSSTFVVSSGGNITTVGSITSTGAISTTSTLTVDSTSTFNGANNSFPNITTSTSAANLRWGTTTNGRLFESTASSARFKTDIVDLTSVDELDPKRLLNLPVHAFRYRDDYLVEDDERSGALVPGFIAEEVDQFYPIAADYELGQPNNWNDKFMIPAMLSLIQDLYKEIALLKGE